MILIFVAPTAFRMPIVLGSLSDQDEHDIHHAYTAIISATAESGRQY